MSEQPVRRHGRRAQRAAAPGSDPTPQAVPARSAARVQPAGASELDAPVRASEDTDRAWGDRPSDSNDERLRQDVPPHWHDHG